MSYALIENGAAAQYPYSFADLRRDNPDVSFPRAPSDEWLAEHGIVKVAPVARPASTATTNFVEGTPALVSGVWTQTWTEVAASTEQIADRQKAATDEAHRQTVRADNFVANFITMTPAEVSAYVDTNVTNLASAKTAIGKLAIMVLLLAKREFRE